MGRAPALARVPGRAARPVAARAHSVALNFYFLPRGQNQAALYTGVSTAFLLSVLGVDRRVIEADYILTNLDVDRQVDFIESQIGLPDGMDRKTMLFHAGVPETAMHDFLNGLDEQHGGALGYLKAIGISDETMAAVRTCFLSN